MQFSEQLKSQIDIVDVIGQYVRLKRSGAAYRYVGLCPFHSEKTPSFHVNANGQFYYCFGCQASGDVFKFVQQMDGLTFPETLQSLAERYGIPVPQRTRPDDPEEAKRKALLEMHEIAATVFQDNLRGANGASAREYLNNRGVAKESVDEFRLGLSDPSGQQLVSRLQKFGQELMEISGLVKRRESGGFYDAFRARLMFPIHNESGKVIAFGGRALRDEDNPKYLNSPETPIYKKSSVLYNLHRAKSQARKADRMILVEGYMDVIGVYAAGFQDVVASCGTALSNDQVRMIKRQIAQQQASNGRVILNFDPDAAGSRTAEKYIGHFLAEGVRVRVLQLPGELDPDEFIKARGSEEYGRQLETAPSYFHWLAERARSKFDLSTPEGRVDAFKSIQPALQLVSDRVERSAIIVELSEMLKLDRDVIAAQLKPASTRGREPEPTAHRTAAASVPPNEIILLTCLIRSEDARQVIQQFLSQSGLTTILETRPVFDAVLALSTEGVPFSIDAIASRLDDRHRRLIANLSFSEIAFDESAAMDQAIQCLSALETKAHEAKRTALRQQIRELEQRGDLNAAFALMKELESIKTVTSGV